MIENTAMVMDTQARAMALDTTQSFIVQAPAGSGKTGLLVQRFLALLSCVEKVPEECLSITFTRKAANEMKERILSVLQAGTLPYPEKASAFVQKNWHLAQAVLKRDATLGWHLLENPARLQIQTIDALCARIVRQMPLLSGFGVLPAVSDEPDLLYEQAAMRLLESTGACSQALQHVLIYLDNDIERLKKLLISLLPRRDQWLPYLVSGDHQSTDGLYALRQRLEAGLQAVITTQLVRLTSIFPESCLRQLAPMAVHAASTLQQQGITSPIRHCIALASKLPKGDILDLKLWEGIAELLLTKEGGFRKQVTAQQGFLAPSQAKNAAEKKQFASYKQEMLELIAHIQSMPEAEMILLALAELRVLPSAHYSQTEWGLIQALFQLLPMLVAELILCFQEAGQVDFVEINMAANRGLGEVDEPSPLLLHLDARLRHILVDEFQDTSRAQYCLLEKLTAGWEQGDGRTIFLVGDPMQSIYRFRQAEVGLFLQAARQGIGHIALQSLQLGINFRSAQAVVDWNNHLYAQTFPKKEDVSMGAVPFWSSIAYANATFDRTIGIAGVLQDIRDDVQEAKQIIAWIHLARTNNPKGSIAILARTRAHLGVLLPALAEANITYTGVDIETLGNSPIVRDLMTVTRALYYLSDRVAWLALLRMPWCRISLGDLEKIVQYVDKQFGKAGTIWAGITAATCSMPDISQETQAVLQDFYRVWPDALVFRDQHALRDSVENIWVSLGGEAYYQARFPEYDSVVNQYYDVLDTPSAEEWLLYPALFESNISGTFCVPKVPLNEDFPPVMVMTLHKAKGLEFDTVILPGLGKPPLKDKKQLLLWGEHVDSYGQLHHLFAPIVKGKTTESPIYQFLQASQAQRLALEALRLLYVATTRAKKQLYWIGHLKDEKPASNSLLSLVWPAIQQSLTHFNPGR